MKTANDVKTRLGFMRGQCSAPDNFNELYQEEIIEMFCQSATECHDSQAPSQNITASTSPPDCD